MFARVGCPAVKLLNHLPAGSTFFGSFVNPSNLQHFLEFSQLAYATVEVR